MGGKSSNMQRMLASAKPVFLSLTLKVSMAFETIHVSTRRRASSCSFDIKGSMRIPRATCRCNSGSAWANRAEPALNGQYLANYNRKLIQTNMR
jgi:hypothetical protein